MKWTLSLITLSLMFVTTGCVHKHVEKTKYVKPEPTYKIKKYQNCSKETCTKDEPLCALDTKTVNYVDSCDGSFGCAFPVTVRKLSNCKQGGIK